MKNDQEERAGTRRNFLRKSAALAGIGDLHPRGRREGVLRDELADLLFQVLLRPAGILCDEMCTG